MDKSISIIIPTYNEKDNIVPLVKKLHDTLSGYKHEIVFVDDNSGDGTIELTKSLGAEFPVKIIVRKNERGLATAVVEGFKHATGDVFVVMDADLQHPPEFIPSLLKAIEDGADIAVSSRYVQGGGTREWSLSRRIISRGAIFISHLLLPNSRKVKDITTGFFALKRSVVDGANLKPIGWKILLEVIYEGKYQKAVEVPFVFTGRTQGKSKLNTKQEMQYLKHIWSLMLRKGELIRFIKFCIVGAIGIGVNEGVLTLVTLFTDWSKYIAVVPGIEVSIISNFLLNDFFTFSDRRAGKSFIGRLLKYNLLSGSGALLNIGIYSLITGVLGLNSLPERLTAELIAIFVAYIWNFLSNSWWTWK